MTTKKPEYDRYAKQLWVKVYQDARSQKESRIIAKDIADLAMADYMNSIHGVTSVVKENFTTGIELENIRKERDNYYDRLQELRKDNADLQAENNQIRIKLSDTLYDLVETQAENKRLKEKLDLKERLCCWSLALDDESKNKFVDTTNMIEVPFTLDEENDVEFDAGDSFTDNICTKLNRMYIDQTRIKRILLEMKSEDE